MAHTDFNGKPAQLYHNGSPVSSTNPLPTSESGGGSTGRDAIDKLINDNAGTNITTGAWLELAASTSAEINRLEIFHSSDKVLILAFGGSGSESGKIYIFPGGNGPVDLKVPASTRLSVKAVGSNATTGTLLINCYS